MNSLQLSSGKQTKVGQSVSGTQCLISSPFAHPVSTEQQDEQGVALVGKGEDVMMACKEWSVKT